MDNRIQKLKQGIYKIALSSTILFVISILLTAVFITLLVISPMGSIWWLWLGLAALFGLICLFTMFSLICGFTFLKVNEKWTEVEKVRKKAVLDWGLFYFYFANKIDKFSSSKLTEVQNT
ncbi:hypothetical protein [Spiroplasma diminutum]|uniref:Transmembrane protein n=1 Tax=Spiroplasma diminutum CUAS-1 TaxID=1276221 RepID=S5LWP5_9MOLU|nr:hypothetical protein [Spiroplasma diminutum]AGR42174.1 hypothetical protein SDIMI_v3c04700 [Spiroplasma diminutum CUAS-1]